jgi:hypothetical protein
MAAGPHLQRLRLTAHLSPGGGRVSLAGAALALAPAATVVLAIGTVVAYPFEMDTIVTLARGRLVATHYGLYNTLSGVGINVGNLATGAMWDAGRAWHLPALPWIVLAGTSAVCAAAVAALDRTGRLTTTTALATASTQTVDKAAPVR